MNHFEGWADAAAAARASLAVLASAAPRGFSDEELLRAAGEVEAMGRLVDALRVGTAGEIAERSRWELGAGGLAARWGDRHPEPFLAGLLRTTQAEARRRVRLGRALRAGSGLDGAILPGVHAPVAEAVAAGALGVEAALAIVTAMEQARRTASGEQIAAAEGELVAAAVSDDADSIRTQATVWREVLDPDGAPPREDALRLRRAFRLGREREGMTPFSGAVDPLRAALLRSVLDDANRPGALPRFLPADDRGGDRVDGDRVDGDRADDTVEVTRPDGSTIRVPRDRRTREQRQCDTVFGLIEAGLRNDGTGPHSFRHTTEVVVVVDAATLPPGTLERFEAADPLDPPAETWDDGVLVDVAWGAAIGQPCAQAGPGVRSGLGVPSGRGVPPGRGMAPAPASPPGRGVPPPAPVYVPAAGAASPPGIPGLGRGGGGVGGVGWIDGVTEPVSIATVSREICAHGYRLHIAGPNGRVLHLSRRRRAFTARQVRALAVRDGGCAWPGCAAPPSWCDAHHVIEYSRGGRTRVSNGVLLCGQHHHLLHGSAYRMSMRHGRPHLLAPAWLDPAQRWIPLGRSRLETATRVNARR